MVKRTFQPKVRRRKKKMGFLSRMKNRGGRKTINRRRQHGRKRIAG